MGTWPRRRFLAAAAATSLVKAAGAVPGALGRAELDGAGPQVADRFLRKPPTQLDHLPIHGSPHLLATELPAFFESATWTRSDARVIHFHLPRDERERLLHPLP